MRSETLRMALQVLTRNPGRSALTVLGLAIGVAAFIAMVSFGQGARRSVLLQFESLGANILRLRSRANASDAVTKPPHPLADGRPQPRLGAMSGSDLDDFLLTPLRTFELLLGIPDGFAAIELRPVTPATSRRCVRRASTPSKRCGGSDA
jgi:hypothetical protein